MSVIIRSIAPDDVPTVREQIYSHLSPTLRAQYLASHPAMAARTEAILAARQGICVVAEQAGGIIGYIIGSVADPVTPSIRYAEIEHIRVEPPYRGQGIGSRLLDGFRHRAVKLSATRLSVDVSPQNTAALRFYRRHKLLSVTLTLEAELA